MIADAAPLKRGIELLIENERLAIADARVNPLRRGRHLFGTPFEPDHVASYNEDPIHGRLQTAAAR